MTTEKHNEVRKALAIGCVQRCVMLELPHKTCFNVARSYFIGASKMAHILGDEPLANYLKEAFAQITDAGYKIVPKWAGINDTVGGNDNPAATAKAA